MTVRHQQVRNYKRPSPSIWEFGDQIRDKVVGSRQIPLCFCCSSGRKAISRDQAECHSCTRPNFISIHDETRGPPGTQDPIFGTTYACPIKNQSEYPNA